jgi:Rrf2 family protein
MPDQELAVAAEAMNGKEPLWHVLSRSAEYAVRAVIELASRNGEGGFVPANELAAVLAVPERYLGRVLNTLARAGVLASVRGQRGGFTLRTPATELTLAEVIAPFDAVGLSSQCLLRRVRCNEKDPCAAHALWRHAADPVVEFFRTVKVAQLVRKGARPAA